MPDTAENQKEYPQQRGQKKGCGFPIMRCVMLFCLSTGAALEIAMGRYRGKQAGENSLLQAIKEFYAHMIAYNLIRDLIVHTSIIYQTSPSHLSHKNAVQALNAFADKLKPGNDQLEAIETALYESIMEHTVGDRKPRVHPREIKRRPKNYKLM